MIHVSALDEASIPACIALRQRCLREHPTAFGSDPEHDRFNAPGGFERLLEDSNHAVFLARRGDQPVGMAGIFREPRPKTHHRACIWGVYVTPEARGMGAGEALIGAALAHARAWEGVHHAELSVSGDAPAAERLYTRLGFVAWGREPGALCWQGALIDKIHMIHPLDR